MPTLSPYQVEGAEWLASKRRAILADRVGLGKTAQAISACDRLGCRRVLVVAPKTLLHNWAREIGLWSEGDVHILTTRNDLKPGARWTVTNYEVVVRRPLFNTRWDALVVDEAHRIKNRKAQRTRAIFRLARRVPVVFLLTGTPLLNRPDELWPLLHAVDPETFRSYWRWVDRHCLQETVVAGGRPVATKVVGVIDEEALRRELSAYMLMRDASVIDLPPRLEEVLRVELSPRQRRQYEQMRQLYVADLGDEVLVAQNALTRLLRLQQLALDPRLVGGSVRGAKTDAILEFIEDHPDEKILVFSTFKGFVRLLGEELQARGIGSVAITGDHTPPQRQAAADRFQTDEAVRVLLGTYDAMSEGLNLQAADIVIHANKPWVPSLIEQAEARALRRGRSRPVTAVSVVADRTVDAYIEEVLATKLLFVDVVTLYKHAVAIA